MKYEELRTKLNEASEQLVVVLEQRIEDLRVIQENVLANLSVNKESALLEIVALENALKEHSEERTQAISGMKSVITHYQELLEQDLSNYWETHNAHLEKEQILLKKDETLHSFKQPKKKETQEINQKINNLDRECITILKTRATDFEEEEKNHKARIQELEKRMKMDVNRINEAILTPIFKDNEERFEEVYRSQDYKNSKEVYELRLKGIQDIARTKVKFNEELRKEELNFKMYVCNYEKENTLLREEYKQRIEILKYEKSEIQAELQEKIDEYDFEAYQKTNASDREYHLYANKIIENSNLKTFEKQDEIEQEEIKSFLSRHEHMDKLYQAIYESDDVQLAQFLDGFSGPSQVLQDQFHSFHQGLKDILEGFQKSMIATVQHFWDQYYANELQVLNLFVLMSMGDHNYAGFQYDLYRSELMNLFESFKNEQRSRLKTHQKAIDNSFARLFALAEDFYLENIQYKNQEANRLDELVMRAKALITKAKQASFLHASAVHQDALNVQAEKISHEKLTKAKKQADLKASNALIEKNYQDATASLEEKIALHKKRLEQAKINRDQLFKDTMKNIKSNMEEAKAKYKKDLKLGTEEINKKYKNEIRLIEAERKTKIKIGQI